MTELQALQNATNGLNGIEVYEKHMDDKRKTITRFFASKNGTTISPVLDYDQMNHFLLGYRKATHP